MEWKIQSSVGQISMLLFLAITVVSAKEQQKLHQKLDNLNAVIYVGDSNVTVGKPFRIQCYSKLPIEWHKDGKPIQEHFVRHSKDEFNYVQHDVEKENQIIESTLSVNHALLRHSGKYKCNIRYLNSHTLHVSEISEVSNFDEVENDHLEVRVSFEPAIDEEEDVKSTMMVFVEDDEFYSESEERITTTSVFSTTEMTKTVKKVEKIVVTTDVPYTTPQSSNLPVFTTKHPVIMSKGKLEPKYENDDKYELFDIGKELVFQCKPTSGDGKGIVWTKNGEDVKKVEQLNGNYEINSKEGKLIIKRAHEDDAGNYTCSLDGESYTFNAWAKVLVKIPSNSYVIENEKVEITCIVKGTDAKIEWRRGTNSTNEPNSDDYIELEEEENHFSFEDHDKVAKSRLVISNAKITDYGWYMCEGINQVMELRGLNPASDEGLLRVKDKLAALWPFLGICAEVFILCTIILIYEKRRNKTDLDESDTDQSPDQKNRK